MTSTRFLILAAAGTLTMSVFVGCGDNDEESAASTESSTESAGGETQETEPEAPPREAMACAGDGHTCLLKADGSVFCWGKNISGQVGDGTRQNRWAPVPVAGVTDATQIACGRNHSCALLSSGAVTCWGSNTSGQLGAGDTDIHIQPVSVQGLSDAAEIALGYDYGCVRKQDGTVACWGNANSGRVGPGASDEITSPRPVQGLGGATVLATGNSHACAIVAGGAVHCWGGNGFGQLGRGEGSSRSGVAPVQGLTGATALGLGNSHSCAATAGGVQCWGYDSDGQLGNGAAEGEEDRSPTPVAVQGIEGTVVDLTAGSGYTCAVADSGQAYCWGNGSYIGAEQRDDAPTATALPALTGVRQISAGSSHACALKNDGALFCWGRGSAGALGNGERNANTPISIFADVASVSGEAPQLDTFEPDPSAERTYTPKIVVARSHVLGLEPDGRIRVFGQGSAALGIGSPRSVNSQDEMYVRGISDAVDIDSWWEASCAVRANGELACWGNIPASWDNHELASSSLPLAMDGVSDAVEVAVGQSGICIRHQAGTLSCMGTGRGLMGNNSREGSDTFVQVQGIDNAVQVELGYATACARTESGELWCWGSNHSGELGNGSNDSSNVPVQVSGLTGVTDFDVDYHNVCAVHRGGRVSCWGENDEGQLANGNAGDDLESNTPGVIRGINNATHVALYQGTVCATLDNGEAKCWGENSWGQVGFGDGGDDAENVDSVTSPQDVLRSANESVNEFGPYATVQPGMSFSCARHLNGHLSCSGSIPINRGGGLLGLSATRSRSPVPVPGFTVGAQTPDEN